MFFGNDAGVLRKKDVFSEGGLEDDPSTGSGPQEEIIIGSVEELMTEIQKSMDAGFMTENPFAKFEVGNMSKENYANIDLHKNIVDEIILVSASGNFSSTKRNSTE